jgi:hypothetical protein
VGVCTLHVTLSAYGDHPDVLDTYPDVGQPLVLPQATADRLPQGGHPLGERLGQRHPGQQVERGLLGEFGQQTAELLQRGGPPQSGCRVDAEVQPGRSEGRVDHPVGHRGLHSDVLEVHGPAVEQQRLFPVIDRDLAQRRVQRTEPEGLAGAVVGEPAVAEMPDVGGRVGAQVTDESEPADVGHFMLLRCRQVDDKARHGFSST